MKQSISGGWYLAFFVIGILLGLLVLQLMDGRDPLQSLLPTSQQHPAALTHQQTSEERHHSAPRPVVKNSSPPVRASAAVAAHEIAAEPAVKPDAAESSAPLHEPINCDHKSATGIRDKAREVAEITDYGDHLSVKLRGEWAYYSDRVRRSFVHKFAESDACLNGQSRPIAFFYQGKLYAQADPDKGINFE